LRKACFICPIFSLAASVIERMDLDALRAGIDWRFQSFAEYLTMLRGRGPYMNLGLLVGHSAARIAVMGDEASVRQQPTAAEMQRLVAAAMDEGAIGLGASYSLNHPSWGGVPMLSTISDLSEFNSLVGAMGSRAAVSSRFPRAHARRDGGDRCPARPAGGRRSQSVARGNSNFKAARPASAIRGFARSPSRCENGNRGGAP
jgi:hypothetical protein